MIEYIGIIIGSICVIALGIVCYFFYNKISVQQTTIEQLIMRQRSMEATIFRPPPKQEINHLYKTIDDDCDDCVVKPFTPPFNDDDKTTDADNSTNEDAEKNEE